MELPHWVLLSTDQAPSNWGVHVDYPKDMRHSLRTFLPTSVVGRYYGRGHTLLNGDFTISHHDLLAGDLDRITRVQPTPADSKTTGPSHVSTPRSYRRNATGNHTPHVTTGSAQHASRTRHHPIKLSS